MKNIASRIIAKCGGHQQVADMLEVHVSRCHRWTYPKTRGGTDGLIPLRQQQKLIEAARARGIELSPADFFDMPGDLKRAS